MKKMLLWIVIASLAIPCLAHAGKETQSTVSEYGETELDPSVIEQIAPENTPAKKTATIEEKNIGAGGKNISMSPRKKTPVDDAGYGAETTTVVIKKKSYLTNEPTAGDREGKFGVGFVGPGIGVANKGVGAVLTLGAEGEYFFFEKLSAGLRIEAFTRFSSATIVDFMPRARYFFDFEGFPRWSVYAQAGAGYALYRYAGSNYSAADIAIPGGGFWWQWTDKWSVGADTSLHIFVRSGATAVGFTFAPAIRYLF